MKTNKFYVFNMLFNIFLKNVSFFPQPSWYINDIFTIDVTRLSSFTVDGN